MLKLRGIYPHVWSYLDSETEFRIVHPHWNLFRFLRETSCNLRPGDTVPGVPANSYLCAYTRVVVAAQANQTFWTKANPGGSVCRAWYLSVCADAELCDGLDDHYPDHGANPLSIAAGQVSSPPDPNWIEPDGLRYTEKRRQQLWRTRFDSVPESLDFTPAGAYARLV